MDGDRDKDQTHRVDMDHWFTEDEDSTIFHLSLTEPESGAKALLELPNARLGPAQATFIASLSQLFIEAMAMVFEEERTLSVVDDAD